LLCRGNRIIRPRIKERRKADYERRKDYGTVSHH
jgi:hypothetical protein